VFLLVFVWIFCEVNINISCSDASREKRRTKQWFTICVADTVTTVLGHDVLLLHHLGVPGAVSQLLLCNGMVVSPQND